MGHQPYARAWHAEQHGTKFSHSGKGDVKDVLIEIGKNNHVSDWELILCTKLRLRAIKSGPS